MATGASGKRVAILGAGKMGTILLQALLKLDRYGTELERHVIDGYRQALEFIATESGD